MDNKTIQTVGMLVFRNNFNEVLLTKHKDTAKHKTGKYGIPAGRVEPNESETSALLREFKEETGLETTVNSIMKLPFEYSAVIERKNEPPKLFSLKVWYAKEFVGQPTETIENIPEWVVVKDLDKLDLLPNMYKVVTDAQKYLV